MKKFISIFTLSLILITGIMLSGCKQPGDVLLSLNTQKIEMLVSDQPAEYSLLLENYDKDVSFDFEFADNFAVVLSSSVVNVGGGKYTFAVTPLTSGTTTLKITLRGTEKVVEVPVVISEELQKIEINKTLFVKKGENLVLDGSYFKFTPDSTLLKDLSFSVKEGQELDAEINFIQQTNTLAVGELTTANEIVLVATSTHDSTKTCEFTVKVVEEIDSSLLIVHTKHNYNQNTGLFDDNTINKVYGYEQADNAVTEKPVTLIRNSTSEFLKQIIVEYSFNDEFGVDVYASAGLFGDIADLAQFSNGILLFVRHVHLPEVRHRISYVPCRPSVLYRRLFFQRCPRAIWGGVQKAESRSPEGRAAFTNNMVGFSPERLLRPF